MKDKHREHYARLGMLVAGFVLAWLMLTISNSIFSPSSNLLSAPKNASSLIEVDELRPSNIQLGNDNAENIIHVFNDYECPFCRRHELALQNLIDHNTNVKIDFYHYPLPEIHPGAFQKARFVECVALTDGNTLGVHEAMFNVIGHADSTFLNLATRYGDSDSIMKCFHGKNEVALAVDDLLKKDELFASTVGIRSTPSSIINNILIPGAAPMEIILQALK